MRKKILVLTSVYPANNVNHLSTKAVHHFCKEWAVNNDVLVINTLNYYPKIFYYISSLLMTYWHTY